MNQLTSKLHSLLFVTSKPLTVKQLVKFANATEAEVVTALEELSQFCKDSGVVLLHSGSQYQLATNSNNSDTVTDFLNSDLREQLTEATAEVLAIIAYRQPITKVEIESIRGVNSQYSIRALLMRGLIEKVSNPSDARSSMYQVTTEFLQQLGVTSINDVPSFEELTSSIKLPEAPAIQDNSVTENSSESQQADI